MPTWLHGCTWGRSRGAVARPSHRHSVPRVRILIVRLGAFGDIVHTLPLAADLAAAGHEVHWLCEDRWAVLLRGSAAVTQVHELPRRVLRSTVGWGPKWRVFRQLLRQLRRARFELVIDAQGLAKSAVFSAFCGASRRIGHQLPRAREGSWLISHMRTPANATHVIDQQRALGLPLLQGGAHGPWRFPLPAWTAEHVWAQAWLRARGLHQPWVLNVGAGWPTKVWPPARQVAFARLCQARGVMLLVVWGNAAEHAIAEQIVRESGHGAVAPDTTIPQLAGLLAGAAVVVSGDTGPLHLALAVGTPAVGLFGPVPAERNGPRGRSYRTLQAPGAAWERRDVSKVDMGAISAMQVVEAAAAVAR